MIRFDTVSKTFQRRRVLDGVSLDIATGTRIALVGSNGAGKTTLIRCLLGEYTRKGSVTIDGMDPRQYRREVLSAVGFVPQLPPPLKMPVGDLIRFAASVSDADPARMEAMAARLGLDMETVRRQAFVKLSGGQKQKLLIGIALGRDTRLLVMDEPAANLDPESRRVFFSILAEKEREAPDMVMIISSHRLDEVASLVNRVIEMDRGKVVLDDHVEDAVDLASTLTCIVEVPRPDEALAKALGEWKFTEANGGLKWEGRVAGPDRLRFLGTVSRYAGVISGLTMTEASQ